MFAKGFCKKTRKKKEDPDASDKAALDPSLPYPSPNTSMNVSGSDKVAASMPGLQPPKEPLMGERGGHKPLSKPARVTTQMSTYGAPKGAVGVTGVSNTKPFARAMGNFGQKPRLGLKSIRRVM